MANLVVGKIKAIIKSPLFWVLLVCGLWEIFYYSHTFSVMYPDSASYDSTYSGSITRGIIDPFRVPIYPIFIKIVKFFFGNGDVLSKVVVAQCILFFVSIILFYAAIKKVTNKKWLTVVLSLLYGCLPHIINWNMLMLTESISTIETVGILYLTVSFLKKAKAKTAIAISVLTLITVLTRPAMIFLLPIYLLFWIIKIVITKKSDRKEYYVGFCASVISILAIIGYCFGLFVQHGAFGLSYVSAMNKTWMVALSGVEMDTSMPEMLEIAKNESPENVYRALRKQYSDDEIDRFVSKTIKKNKNEYMMFLANKFASTSNISFGDVYTEDNKEDIVGAINDVSFLNFGTVYAIVACGIVSILYSLFRRKTIDWVIAFLIGFIFCNVFLSVFMAPFETARLCVVSIPVLLLLAAYWVNVFVYKDKKLRLEEDILSKKASKSSKN